MHNNNTVRDILCVKTLFIRNINSNRDNKNLRKRTKRKRRDTTTAKREGSEVQKMKKRYCPRQVNRAPALYNAGCVKLHNEASLNGERKKASRKAESNNPRHLSRITIFYRVFQKESTGCDVLHVTRTILRINCKNRIACNCNYWKKKSINYISHYCKKKKHLARKNRCVRNWRTGFRARNKQIFVMPAFKRDFSKCFRGD